MIYEIDSIGKFIRNGNSLENRTIQQVDFTKNPINWQRYKIHRTTFLGCKFTVQDKNYLIEQGAVILERPEKLPYDPFRKDLYTWQELLEGHERTNDERIYDHFQQFRHNPPINEALWQRIHDHAIDDALREFIRQQDSGMPDARCVGVMGGHQTSRLDPIYTKVAFISKWLTEKGYLVITGGGPGVMEAANMGAFLAHQSDQVLGEVILHLADAPTYRDANFTKLAVDVWHRFTKHSISLAIPTWFYGHEPTNVFATAIAKYFSNSIREDTLLAICVHGVIFAPGSAGTLQEIFMDVAQNHYGTYNFYSPMVFLDRNHYEDKTLIYPLLQRVAKGQQYEKMLFVEDDPETIVHFIDHHPPIPVK